MADAPRAPKEQERRCKEVPKQPTQKPDAETLRKRKATANRALTVLKAALNKAWEDGLAPSADAWRRVKPFREVDQPKVRYLSEADCARLTNAAPGDFRDLVQGALSTGCRYGESVKMRCGDYSARRAWSWCGESKGGKPRYVPSPMKALRCFSGSPPAAVPMSRCSAGVTDRPGRIRTEATHGRGLQRRPDHTGSKFPHSTTRLRSCLAQRGVSLQVVAELSATATRE